ncbi:Lipopolysaccharide export system permease protein LptG [compost metagenome]
MFWGFFIGSMLVIVTIFTAVDALSSILAHQGVTASALISYYLYYIPEIVQKMLPVACLAGVIMTLANMNRANELVALFASGMSLLRITMPMLISVVIISGLGFFMGDRLIPMMTRQKNFILYHDIEKNPAKYSIVKTDRIWYRSKNAIFNIKTLNKQGDVAQGLTLYFFNDDWDLLQMISAKEVDLNGTQWTLKNGSVTVFTKESSFPLTSQFRKKTIVMSEDAKDLQGTGQTSDMLTQSELKRYIDKNREAGLDTLRYEVDYQSKFSFALSGLVMCLLGIPFSVGRARSGGTMLSIGIALGLVFSYYVLYSSGLTLGQNGALSPVVATWGPNIVMAGFGLFMLRRLKR